jgi:hypothetical protein
MDLGVGSFVFSQGVVSAIPLLKDPSYLTASVTFKFVSIVRKTLPIILLGIIRVLLVKGTEYPVVPFIFIMPLRYSLRKLPGTRIRVRNPLELFYNSCPVAGATSVVASSHITCPCFAARRAGCTRYLFPPI